MVGCETTFVEEKRAHHINPIPMIFCNAGGDYDRLPGGPGFPGIASPSFGLLGGRGLFVFFYLEDRKENYFPPLADNPDNPPVPL